MNEITNFCKVRDLAKGPEWYYLSDKPESERKPASMILNN